MRKYSKQSPKPIVTAAVFTISAAILGGGIYGGYQFMNPTHVFTATVQDKVRTGGQDSKYLIFTDKGVYENTDSIVNGKWNSSDVYGALSVGKSYEFKVRGRRIPFLSMYPNIITEKPVK